MTEIADVFNDLDSIMSAYRGRTVGAGARCVLDAAEAWGEASAGDGRDAASDAYDEAVTALAASGEEIPWHTYRGDEGGEVVFATTAAEAMGMIAPADGECSPKSTVWISYGVRSLLHDDGADNTVTIDPTEPKCAEGHDHEWKDGGVHGNGGGVVSTDVCVHCGLVRATDTWAQDGNGQRGLTSILYEMPAYAVATEGGE